MLKSNRGKVHSWRCNSVPSVAQNCNFLHVMEQGLKRHWNVLEYYVWTSVGNLITFHWGSEPTEPVVLALKLPLALRLSHGSHFGADYSWCYCTDVSLHWILSLGHPALKAIKFSVSMNKSESSASDHAVQRVPKLIIGALQNKKKRKKKPLFQHRGNICSIKYVRRAGVGGRVVFLDLKPSMWCQTAFPEVSIRISLRVNDSEWDLLGNWSSAKPLNV